MRLIAWTNLSDFGARHPQARPGLDRWRYVVRAGEWATPEQVRATFSGAKFCGPNRIRFEISGGDYRLIAAFNFHRHIAFVPFIGTHAEYDAIDAATVSLF